MPLPVDSAVECVCPAEPAFDRMPSLRALRPFDDEVCAFLQSLSAILMADKEAREYPDVVTFGFFCRKGNIQRLKDDYVDRTVNRLGRGVTFHIAPSNVPVNFAYSLVCGLLAGNACIVRAPSKPFPQTSIICRAIVEALTGFASLKDYIAIVKYERDEQVTAHFSSLCDVRIIWGGDETVQDIRRIPIPPRATELTFADRYSLCVIEAEQYLALSDPSRVAQDFYNDTYLFDQNACSSPRLMVWIGSEESIHAAKQRFWAALHEVVASRYTLAPVLAVDKLTTVCRCAIEIDGVKAASMPDHLIDRIHIKSLPSDPQHYTCAGGSFLEYHDRDLASLRTIITRKYQTLCYIGFQPETLREWVLSNGLPGIDRIVPVGRTAEFTSTWDGHDLITALSRICVAK